MTSKLRDKLLKNSQTAATQVLKDTKLFDVEFTPTPVPALNVALSGSSFGGLASGLTVWAGPSKHFKSLFSLIMAAVYMKKNPDAICLFYDNEFGSPPSYFKSVGIPDDRVIHTPITTVEQLKNDIVNQLEGIDRGDKVIIVIDSIGNLASKKETEDAISGKDVADMTRAKAIKSLFRIVTPYLTIKDIPLIVVAHTYKTMDLFPQDVVGGGTGSMYSSNSVFILGKKQVKDSKKELTGNEFVIKVEKSRFIKEKSKIDIEVGFEEGIVRWSGLLEMAMEGGYISKVGKGKYQVVDKETGELIGEEYSEKKIKRTSSVWENLLKNTDFDKFIQGKYKLSSNAILSEEENSLPDDEDMLYSEEVVENQLEDE